MKHLSEDVAKVRIAHRVAEFVRPGEYVNLGVGIPTMVADFLAPGAVCFHSENGILGVGPKAGPGQEDPDLINAGRQGVTELPGSSYFDSALSFGMIRGGHITTTVLGTLQVDVEGTIANWKNPAGGLLGVGGAMDLCTGARRVIVATTLFTRNGEPKVVDRCTMPVTATREADVVVTEFAVFEKKNGRLTLTEIAPEITLEEMRSLVRAAFDVAADLKTMRVQGGEANG
ncbi:MAG: 3-oxoacid CoA-transferase subunit B [Firmicutes bacterium]|nr:3-oxoacid CoA-transferase subunit B [Bacillota bacterium]